jgi:hypothetical protein
MLIEMVRTNTTTKYSIVNACFLGQIEWSEFLAAMTEWLQEDYKNRLGSNKRRKLNPEQVRSESFHERATKLTKSLFNSGAPRVPSKDQRFLFSIQERRRF